MTILTAPFKPDTWKGLAFAGTFSTEGVLVVGWEQHRSLTDEAFGRVYPKGKGPSMMYATTYNNRRRSEDIVQGGHVTGLAIDLDEGLNDLVAVEAALSRLRELDVSFHYQVRKAKDTYKVHIAIPYADPYPVLDVGSVKASQCTLMEMILGQDIVFDHSTAKAAGILFLMTQRPDSLPPDQEHFHGKNALDMISMFPTWTQGVAPRKSGKGQVRDEADLMKSVLEVHRWNEPKGAWEITCPVGHDEDYASKTYLYPSGTISCMAGRCQGKPLAWFLDHLPDEARAKVAQSSTMLKAEATSPKVSVAQAHEAMTEALKANRAIEGHATVIQVSTGAGKTRTIAEMLNQYSAPFEDEGDGSGLTSVLAVPTNALLREVENRINIPHRRQFGVLAVLNDDGTPACKKHQVAMALQRANGNVHKLLCNHCEYKEGCAAREGASTGVGALVLTNHSLMANVAADLHSNGRHPLLVWDESPAWVDTAGIAVKDLEWLLKEFDNESRPLRGADAFYEAMVDVRLFSTRYRVVVRPVIEAVRWIRSVYPTGTIAAKHAINVWALIPTHRMMLDRALAILDRVTTGDAWQDMVDTFTGAYRLNTSEMGYDAMRPDTQRRVTRAEALVGALGLITGEDAVMVLSEQHIMIAALTASGKLLKERGGVVLDATANVAQLKALRPDLRTVSLRVQDRGDSQRYLQHVASLDRKSLSHRTDRLVQCVNHAKRNVRRWATAQNIATPKVAIFTYRDHVKVVQAAWPEAEVGYFGNTRGYDRFFQEGFDAFLTFGDPISNLTALALQWRVLTGANPNDQDPAWRDYVAASAEGELAQAHGRARNPQQKLGVGGRLHMHYGRRIPAGWDSETMRIDPLTFSAAELLVGSEVSDVEA